MVEKVLKIPLTELKTARVMCKRCKVVFEVSTEDLRGLFSSGQCQCGAVVHAHGHNPLEGLADALEYLAGLKNVLEVEFVIPAED